MRAAQTTGVVVALGSAQTISWASSYYLPAVLATPMARDLDVSPVWIFAAFSVAMLISALVAPWNGVRIDRLGGRGVLIISNVIFTTGLALLAIAPSFAVLVVAWIIIGIGMGMGLYEAAFATLAGIYGSAARSPITGITLIAGFASTLGWPLSALMDAHIGWRGACLGWAALQLLVALPLNVLLPVGVQPPQERQEPASPEEAKASRLTMLLLAYVFAVTLFVSTSLATHLPRLLEAAGATTAVAIAAGALIGPAQVAARVGEFSLLRHMHPLLTARIAALASPLGAMLLILLGAPAAYAFTLLHGAGNGIMTIAKGTLPLALFGAGGYGFRQGLLVAPGRILQASAPLIFGFALEHFGANAIWLTMSLSLTALLALLGITMIRPASA